jgi:hypothetical protein
VETRIRSEGWRDSDGAFFLEVSGTRSDTSEYPSSVFVNISRGAPCRLCQHTAPRIVAYATDQSWAWCLPVRCCHERLPRYLLYRKNGHTTLSVRNCVSSIPAAICGGDKTVHHGPAMFASSSRTPLQLPSNRSAHRPKLPETVPNREH